ncbi:U-scoloptoxin(01)-Cw1a-like isoform X2 [Tachypleus tridentatus]|uniref:U-scoloptoxin(01)-Cw1a-like isoform X2 n=1 Tax=Tachypleus tridentatus TaxID=6853 RepID=UPI003FD2B28C
MMKYVFFVASMFLAITSSFPRVKREAFNLPAGAEEITGVIDTDFSCDGFSYGYYADIQNNCNIFHICDPKELPNGKQTTYHYSFVCGNLTVFNQLTLTCAFPEEAVPCKDAEQFYFVNNNFGIEDALFLNSENVQKGNDVILGYGSRPQKK